MSTGEKADKSLENAARRGLWRLMLRLPALRGRLQLLASRDEALSELFEAYEIASVTLQRLRTSGESLPGRVSEYENICSEIESRIIQLCLDNDSRVPY